jgi:truncated hemoglobin YjbI
MTPEPVVRIAPLLRAWGGGPPPSEQAPDRLPLGRVVFGRGMSVKQAQAVAALLLDGLDAVREAWPMGAAAIRAVGHGRWN